MNKSLIFFVGLAVMLFINTVCANNIQSLGTISKGEKILLKQNCVNATFVNITSISVVGIKNVELLNGSVSMSLVSTGYQTYLFNNNTIEGEYIVTGVCDENGVLKAWSYNYFVTNSGRALDGVYISIYILFLLFCFSLIIFSGGLVLKSRKVKEKNYKELYEIRKRSLLKYYSNLIVSKLWIFGVGGVYLSTMLFISAFTQIFYFLGMTDFFNFFQYVSILLFYGLFILVLFLIVYLILSFYWTTQEALKYQFGGFREVFKK